MSTTNYTLQPYTGPSSRYRCPQCNHRDKCFVRYINTQTGEQLGDNVGRCGREDKCGYHYKPRDYFRDNPQQGTGWQPGKGFYPHTIPKPYAKRHKAYQKAVATGQPGNAPAMLPAMNHEPSTMNYPPPTMNREVLYINPEIVNASFKNYERNNFVQFLIKKAGYHLTDHLLGMYRIGTSKHWPGANVFWQLDALGRVRTGKVMLYDAQTGKRVKKPFNHITWAHVLMRNAEGEMRNEKLKTSAIGIPASEFKPNQCLFGEHLLTEHPTLPVGVVESEKTAIIAAAHAPNMLWLAAGSASNLNPAICQALQNRIVTLYPDLGAYPKWKAKAAELQARVKGSVFMVSDMLEQLAIDDDRADGLDIADYLLTQKPEAESIAQEGANELSFKNPEAIVKLFADAFKVNPAELRQPPSQLAPPHNWDDEIEELRAFFDKAVLPDGPIPLKAGGAITNISEFLSGHLEMVAFNNGNKYFFPYLQRLRELKAFIQAGSV